MAKWSNKIRESLTKGGATYCLRSWGWIAIGALALYKTAANAYYCGSMVGVKQMFDVSIPDTKALDPEWYETENEEA